MLGFELPLALALQIVQSPLRQVRIIVEEAAHAESAFVTPRRNRAASSSQLHSRA